MPWKNYSFKEQRRKFLQLVLAGKTRLVELCRRFEISRKTAYKWKLRFEEYGRRGLADRSRAPRKHHNRPTQKWLNRIRRCRAKHPRWGAPKIGRILKGRFGGKSVPSEASIGRWLRRWDLTRRGRGGARKGPRIFRSKLSEAKAPNEVWTADFKGWFRTGDGNKVEPLTVRDLASRYILAICFMSGQNVDRTRAQFECIFQKYGLPLKIRVDNGSPFGSKGALGLTRLSAWWLKLGIEVEFIEPGHPEQNAAHEQFHRVYQEETVAVPAPTPRAQKARSNQWCWVYNHERPHEGLGMEVPAKIYRRSRRRLPQNLKAWRYKKGWESRLVRGHGLISFNGRSRFVGEAFEGERVGLKQEPPGVWKVYFGPHLIGELWDADTQGIRSVVYRKRRRA